MSEIINNIVYRLAEGNIPSPRLEARILVADVLEVEVTELSVNPELDSEHLFQLEKNINLRLSHMPLDKIIGYRDFYKYRFKVNQNVLSPRPDTEILVEEAIKLAKTNNFTKFLDLGTGSGCILISVIGEDKDFHGVGVDKSLLALEIAKENAHKLGVENQTQFINASWFDGDFSSLFSSKFDMVLSNPPYIPSLDVLGLEDEVKNYDPMSALDGGKDGLDHYRQLALTIPSLLNVGGYVLLEVGIYQASDVSRIFEENAFETIKIVSDLSGVERCIILKK